MISVHQRVELLRLFADPTRVRLTSLLEDNELTVAEITKITALPQSRVSTHLGKLREAQVLRDRKDGASTYYSMNNGAMPPEVKKLWTLVGSQLDEPVLRADRERRDTVLRARHDGKDWPETVAGQMEKHYSPGRTWEATARGLLGLMRLGDVLDGGSGDGLVAELLAPRAKSVTCLDRSDDVLAAARKRLAAVSNVDFSPGDIQQMPFQDCRFDHVLFFNVLVYAENPRHAIAEAARVLRPGGELVVVTVAAHPHPEVTAVYGHVHPGLSPRALRGWLAASGLAIDRCEITSREKRTPHFSVITAFAHKSGGKGYKGKSS